MDQKKRLLSSILNCQNFNHGCFAVTRFQTVAKWRGIIFSSLAFLACPGFLSGSHQPQAPSGMSRVNVGLWLRDAIPALVASVTSSEKDPLIFILGPEYWFYTFATVYQNCKCIYSRWDGKQSKTWLANGIITINVWQQVWKCRGFCNIWGILGCMYCSSTFSQIWYVDTSCEFKFQSNHRWCVQSRPFILRIWTEALAYSMALGSLNSFYFCWSCGTHLCYMTLQIHQ